MITDRFYVITGGPGAGKTTLLKALEQPGFHIVPEVARAVIKEQINTGGTALPWENREAYTQLMLDGSVAGHLTASKQAKNKPGDLFFFDRGILDTLCYATMTGMGISEQMDRIARMHPYNKTVFILPPWKEIYTTDTERRQNWEEAVFTYDQMKAIYTHYDYQVTDVPAGPPETRRAFVLQCIAG